MKMCLDIRKRSHENLLLHKKRKKRTEEEEEEEHEEEHEEDEERTEEHKHNTPWFDNMTTLPDGVLRDYTLHGHMKGEPWQRPCFTVFYSPSPPEEPEDGGQPQQEAGKRREEYVPFPARLQEKQQAEEWACAFSEEWDRSPGFDGAKPERVVMAF